MRRLSILLCLSLMATPAEARYHRYHYYGGRWHDSGFRPEWRERPINHNARRLLRPERHRADPARAVERRQVEPAPTPPPAALPPPVAVPMASRLEPMRITDLPLPADLFTPAPAPHPASIPRLEPVLSPAEAHPLLTGLMIAFAMVSGIMLLFSRTFSYPRDKPAFSYERKRTVEDNSRCQARQYSDQMYCARCSLVWDVNDPLPPVCNESKNP